MNAKVKQSIELNAAADALTVPQYIKRELESIRRLSPGSQPDEWHHIDWLFERNERVEKSMQLTVSQLLQHRVELERLKLLVEVFRLEHGDPSYIDWTLEELQAFHDELSAAEYEMNMPPEWKRRTALEAYKLMSEAAQNVRRFQEHTIEKLSEHNAQLIAACEADHAYQSHLGICHKCGAMPCEPTGNDLRIEANRLRNIALRKP